jgi:hypothetical protein
MPIAGKASTTHEPSIRTTGSLEADLQREPNRIKRFFKMLGPGLQ